VTTLIESFLVRWRCQPSELSQLPKTKVVHVLSSCHVTIASSLQVYDSKFNKQCTFNVVPEGVPGGCLSLCIQLRHIGETQSILAGGCGDRHLLISLL
jgi:hypothetical protein